MYLKKNEIIEKAGRYLDLQGADQYLDSHGAYHFYELKDGIYTVSFKFHAPYTAGIDSLFVELQGEDVIIPDVKVYNSNFEVKTSFKVYGGIVDSDGKVMNDVKVHYYYENFYAGRLHTQTDYEGNFGFDAKVNIKTERNYLIYPEKNGWSFSPDTPYVNLKWINGVEKGDDVIIPEFIGQDFTNISATDYFPLKTGVSWTYLRTEKNNEPYDRTINVTGTVNQNGTEYSRMSEHGIWGFTDFSIDKNVVYAYYIDEKLLFLQFGVTPETEWETGREARMYSRIGRFKGIETVEIPAGTFEDCTHFESIITYSDDSYDSYNLWYAPGAGLVKSVRVVMNYGEIVEQVTDELKSYSIP